MKEKKRTVIKLTILACVIVFLFGAVNAVWYFGYKKAYDDYAGKMEIVDTGFEDGERYQAIVEDCLCQLKMPSYLGYGGYLTVQDAEGISYEMDENGNIVNGDEKTVILHIWPQAFGNDYTYGVSLLSPAETVQIMIQKDGSVVPQSDGNTELDEHSEALLANYQEEIAHLLEIARIFWGIE